MRFDNPLADKITAAVLFLLGAAMSSGGYTMDRLEFRQIHPGSIPGLVPMILGVSLMLCATLLFLSARRTGTQLPAAPDGSWADLGVAAGWSMIFALAMVGRIPFVVAAAIYLAGFTAWFLLPDTPAEKRGRTAVGILVFAILTAIAVSALFRYGFLVRLP